MFGRRSIVLSLLALPAGARAQSDEWQTVVAPDLRCRLEMPAPVNKTTAQGKETGHAAPRIAWEAKRGVDMFDFDYVDYDPKWFSDRDSKVMAKELGRGEAEKAFPKAKYKYVKDEPVVLQGWDGYALDIEGEDGGLVMMRTYIVRDRLYRLLTTAQGDMKSKSAAVRFIDSFRLSDSKQ
ncbi:MAG: hypothetical protein JOY81_13845 [Alphaproteobacteria bacterium]|nr:hypothetical protein [Alphaproteobacteria bacterium]